MASRVINTDPALSNYTQRVVLDGREYQLTLLWNQREAKWYLTLADVDGVVIAAGIKVVADFPLLRRLTDRRAPPGDIIAMDRSGQGIDPGLADLGERVFLTYLEAADIAGGA